MSKIEELRGNLYKAIDAFGINSKVAHKLSQELNEEILKEHIKEESKCKDNITADNYATSYEALKKKTKRSIRFPSEVMWNRYAYKHNYLSDVSLKYISGLDWHKLKKKILKDIEEEKLIFSK